MNGDSDLAELRAEIGRAQREVETVLKEEISSGGRLAVVRAPPGSGKTYTLLDLVAFAHKQKLRIAVSAQTNAQGDDICRRIARDHPRVAAVRFVASKTAPIDLGRNIAWADETRELPTGRCVVVATTSKWGMVDVPEPFDLLLIDEAWQMPWAEFMLCSRIAGRFVLIGDPGQIPPTVTVDTSRWETAEKAPHSAAPEVVLRDPELASMGRLLALPASRRLPHDSVSLVRAFYDFHFDAWAGPGERAILTEKGAKTGTDHVIDLLGTGSAAILTLPTPDGGPPLERDEDLARSAAELIKRLLKRGARFRSEGTTIKLEPEHIGVSATHRVMNTALYLALPAKLRERVVVDTPERWQGLERPLMIAIHPLSGVVQPSEFDLETGRLCVMASRHRGGLVLLTRDHVSETLDRTVPSASQPLGRPDVAGRGHKIHSEIWERLAHEGRIVSA